MPLRRPAAGHSGVPAGRGRRALGRAPRPRGPISSRPSPCSGSSSAWSSTWPTTIEHGRLPRLSLPPRVPGGQAARGVPALAGEPIPLAGRAAQARRCFASATRWPRAARATRPSTSAARRLRTRMDAGSLLAASLARDQAAIRTGATASRPRARSASGWSPSSPSARSPTPFSDAVRARRTARRRRAARARSTAGRTATVRPADRGPRWPRSSAGQRVLRCSFCAFAWELPTAMRACTAAKTASRSSRPRRIEDAEDRRLEICEPAAAYLKTVDVRSCRRFRCSPSPTSRRWISTWPRCERGYRAAAAEGLRPALTPEAGPQRV